MFTSIFSTISVIEDRREGFLQSAMVAPVSRGQIVISKVWGGSLLALLQVILLVPLIFLIDLKSSWINVTLSLAVLFLLANALTALSFFFAWKLNSIQGFHGVMNLILFPMWFLSGALFPATSAPTWLRSLMWVNPMSHALSLVRDLLSHPTFESQSFLIPLSSLFLTAGCFYLLSVRTVSQSQEKSV
jgi:ABC-2 type transport system permease protein